MQIHCDGMGIPVVGVNSHSSGRRGGSESLQVSWCIRTQRIFCANPAPERSGGRLREEEKKKKKKRSSEKENRLCKLVVYTAVRQELEECNCAYSSSTPESAVLPSQQWPATVLNVFFLVMTQEYRNKLQEDNKKNNQYNC